MFWPFKSRAKPAFSAADARQITNLLKPKIEKSVGEAIFLGDFVSTLSFTRTTVAEYLTTLEANTSASEMASALNLSKDALQLVLHECLTATNAVSDGVLITPYKLGQKVVSSISGVGNLSSICQKFEITLKIAESLFVNNQFKVFRGEVFSQALGQESVDLISEWIAKEVEFTFTDVVADPVLAEYAKSQLKLPLHCTKYVPSQIAAKSELIESKLNEILENGAIHVSELKDIDNLAKFARDNECTQYGYYLVLNSYYQTVRSRILSELQSKGFSELLNLNFKLDQVLLKDEKLSQFAVNQILIKPSAINEIATQVSKCLDEMAESTALAALGDEKIDLNTDVDAVLRRAPSLDLSRALEIAHSTSPDLDLPAKVAETCSVKIRQQFFSKVKAHLVSLREQLISKLEARAAVYKAGLATLEELKPEALAEFNSYLASNNLSSKLSVTQEDQQEAYRSLVDVAKSQLVKTRDPANVLLLACLVFHAQNFTSNGMLKIRGRSLPKLLQEFDFPHCFNDLRKKVKSPSAELIAEVKQAALKKNLA